jgi:hypothetical protein
MKSKLLFALILPFVLTHCGSDTRVTTNSQISVGQQLSDLENAHQRGIISDSEYKRLKKVIIRKND